MGHGSGKRDSITRVTFKAVSALAVAKLGLPFLICNLERITLVLHVLGASESPYLQSEH